MKRKILSNPPSQNPKSGITLLEVLCVIAIIGILIPLFHFYYSGALVNAHATRLGNSGKNIVMAIIASNIERAAMGVYPCAVWPNTNTVLRASVTNDYTVGVSEAYFADLITPGPEDAYPLVEGLGWSVFAGGGIGAATSEEQFRAGGHNAWSYIGGVNDNMSGDTPFIFTKNLEITTEDLREFSSKEFDEKKSLSAKLNPKAQPFGDGRVAFVTTGGAMLTVKNSYLKDPRQFFGSAIFNEGANTNATVVAAKQL